MNTRLNIVRMKIEEIKPANYNPRKISKKEWDSLEKSLERFGVVEPLVINSRTGNLVGGHQRLDVLKHRGEKEVDVNVIDLSLEDEKALNLALNKISGEWHEDRLKQIITELSAVNYDLQYTGFDAQDVQEYFGRSYLEEIGLKNPSEEDYEVPVEAHIRTIQTGIKAGDVFQLGEHRIMCGDATSLEDIKILTKGEKTCMVLTDPPYNTGMSAKKNNDSTWLNHMFDDDYTPEEYEKLLNEVMSNYNEITQENAVLYVFLDWRKMHELVPIIKKYYKYTNMIVWDKVVHGLGSDYQYTHELIAVAKKGKPQINSHQGQEYQDIWHVQRKVGRNNEHATAKPTNLLEIPIRHATKEKDLIIDLFAGSGSTIIAAEQTKRKAYGMEISPQYCQVIIERWEKLTGKKAEKVIQN